jgi:putative FmdB family regulatory protein
MPTYEYRCKSCGHSLEVVQAFTDDPLTKCPSCKRKQLKKVFGSIGITFKGSGFYKTDSRSGSSSSASGASGSSEASGDGDTKTETKKDEPKAEKKSDKAEKKKDSSASSTTPAA